MSSKKILITGVAGFIGFHVARRLVERGDEVLGIDNLNDYYDPSLKEARLALLTPLKNFHFKKMDIADRAAMENLFSEILFNNVIHLAAQAGVRYSIENPHAYIQSNIVGFMNILEGCRKQNMANGEGQKAKGTALSLSPLPLSLSLIYASSSSVYGGNTKLPFSEGDRVDHPISLYAATKRADELMAHTYSHLYGIRATGLRFFTVYGPWGRPDMALFKFTKAILAGEPIDVYNEGKMRRDFTYIDDVVEAVDRLTDRDQGPGTRDQGPGTRDQGPGTRDQELLVPGPLSPVPCPRSQIYNLGNNRPIDLMDFIKAIEDALGKRAQINYLPMQPGDVPETSADIDEARRDFDFSPKTPISKGIPNFVKWYLDYYA